MQRFDVKNAHCYGPNGEYKLRQAIAAGPGGAEAFNRIMRKLGDRLAEQKELLKQAQAVMDAPLVDDGVEGVSPMRGKEVQASNALRAHV